MLYIVKIDKEYNCKTDGNYKSNGETTLFMNRNEIDTHTSESYPPILTPFEFLHPKNNHHAKEVESHEVSESTTSGKMSE